MNNDIKDLKQENEPEQIIEKKSEKKIKPKYVLFKYLEVFEVNMDKYVKSYLISEFKDIKMTEEEWEKEINKRR